MKILFNKKILFATIVLLAILVIVLFPFYLKRYINKNGKDLSGRALSLQGLYHNPFTGFTRMTDFKMFEQDDTASFISFDTLLINFDLYKLIGGAFSISELRLVNPVIRIDHQDTVYNFSDLIRRFSDGEASDSTSRSMDIELKNISLSNGVVQYHDLSKDRKWHLDDISLAIPDLYFDNQDTDADLDLKFVDGGELLSSIQYNNQQGVYSLNLRLSDFNLAAAKEYIKDYVNIRDFGATMDANLDISGKLGSPEMLKVSGNIDVSKYFLKDDKDLEPLKGDRISAVMEEVRPFEERVVISSILITNPTILYEIYADSTDNIRPLIISENSEDEHIADNQTDAGVGSDPGIYDSTALDYPDILIKEVLVAGGKLDFRDYNPQTPFEYQFFNIETQITNISFSDTSRMVVKAEAPENGNLELAWEGNFFDLDRQSFTLKTNIPGLPAFSPYTISFFDVAITQGHFSYTSTNHINNGTLEGLHTVIASDIDVGERTGFKSLYDVPLKIGLYLLEDRDGNIHLEIPVEGDVNDPSFRYSKIVVKAIINGLTKIITSPIALIGKLVGAGDNFKDLTYNPIHPEITPDLESKLKYLVEASEKKPQIKFEMTQHFDPEQAKEALSVYLMKRGYYLKTHGNTSIEDFYMINSIDEKDEEFQAFVALESGQDIDNVKALVASCVSLKETEVNPAVDTLAQVWNNLVSAHLLENAVSSGNFSIEEKSNDKGKFEFELGVNLNKEMNSADSLATSN
ncbi:MAG: hypothetical protein DHS20C17_12180 [Cyclobacteriaceae bacterium]|nr:MAG: hypothetical protein DHS20C17_12180 [Cyclobacteriaceae bacterium]